MCVSLFRVRGYRAYSSFPPAPAPLFEEGVVFYAYSRKCSGSRYANEVHHTCEVIRSMEPRAHIALVTNCNLPVRTAALLDVLIPVHSSDLVPLPKQWYTRVLYNAYLPFELSFVLDTHVFPCSPLAYAQTFALFRNSSVHISYSNRMNTRSSVSGGAVLSRFGRETTNFWRAVARHMLRTGNYDDQGALKAVIGHRLRFGVTFKWLSNNFFFASNGIDKNGHFLGSSKCYRSSVVVNGPVRWVHGRESECQLMNGNDNEYAYKKRVYFSKGRCRTRRKTTGVIFSQKDLIQAARPYMAPKLDWGDKQVRPPDGLFWGKRWNVC